MPGSNEAHSTPLKTHHHLLSGHQRARHSSTFSHHRRKRGGSRLPTALGPMQPGMQALTPGATPPAPAPTPARPLALTCPSPSPAVCGPPHFWTFLGRAPRSALTGPQTLRTGQKATSPAGCMQAPHPAQCWIAPHRSAFPSSASGPPTSQTPQVHTRTLTSAQGAGWQQTERGKASSTDTGKNYGDGPPRREKVRALKA